MYVSCSRITPIILAVACCAYGPPVAAQYLANSISQLRTYASLDNATVFLAPGEYWLESIDPTFLDFSGSNSTFNLSAAQLKVDTRELPGYGGSDSVIPVLVSGDNNQILGLDVEGVDVDLAGDPNAVRWADRSTIYVKATGNDNTFQDTTIVSRGSTPYGYGDVFGKGPSIETSGQPVEEGGTAYIGADKASGFLVTDGATNTVVDNLNLTSYSFGHGFVVQGGATNTTIRDSEITGELCQADFIMTHPEYQEYAAGADGILGNADDGGTRVGTPLPEGIQLSCHEDGIRMYGGTNGLTVENTTVTNFRAGVSSTFASGTVTIDNVEVYGAENAFVPGSNTTITNSKANIVNGPAVYVQYNGKSNTTIDVEIVGDQPVGEDWAVAYINGNNFDVTISSDLPAGYLPEDSLVRFGQTWFNNWRDNLKPTTPEEGDPGPFTNSTFTNLTNEYAVLGNLATGNTGYSQGGVVTNGKENHYDGVSHVLSGTHVVLTSTAGLGNNGVDENGDFDADIFETNASIVQGGATLELQPGIRISQEKLTISGDGVDGLGALYTEGTVGTDTRFGSASGSENSAIYLDGDASIGVGVTGQQLNIGGLNGQGDFTKRGPGLLTIGKASTFDGDMTIAEGQASIRGNVVRTNLTVAAGASISANGGFAYNTDGIAQIDGDLDLNARANPEQLTHRIGILTGSGSVMLSNVGAGANATLELGGGHSTGEFTGSVIGAIHLEKSGTGIQVFSGNVMHTGTTEVTEGTLLINGTHSGGNSYTVSNTGTLGGTGVIDAEVLVASGATLAPGASAGTLDVTDLTLEAGSTLQIEIGALGYDLLTGNTIDLAGDLEVSLLQEGAGYYLPESSEGFVVLDAEQSIIGAFGNATGSGDRVLTTGGEGSFEVTYLSNDSVLLSNFLLAGDYNSDGLVNASDYTLWRDTSGQTRITPFSGADGNGDGQIDTADLMTWQGNYGLIQGTTIAVAVPEPNTIALVFATIMIRRPRHRLRTSGDTQGDLRPRGR